MSIPLHLAVHLLGLTAAFGLAVYAVARRDDTDTGWVGLAVGGVLLGVAHAAEGGLFAGQLAWPLYARIAGYAAIAVGAAGRLAGAPVVVAAGPLSAHVAAAVAGLMAAAAAARGVLGRGRRVLPLVLGLAGWAGADLLVRYDVTTGAVLSIVGSAATAWWLTREVRSSLLARFVGSSVAVLVVLAVALAASSGVVFRADLEGGELDRLQELAAAQAVQVAEDWPLELMRIAVPLSGERLASEVTEAAGPGSLDSRARSVTALPGIDATALVSGSGQLLGSWDGSRVEPGPLQRSEAAAIAGDTLVQRALAGQETRGVIAVGSDELVALGVAPVGSADGDGQPVGALVVGRRIAQTRIVESIRSSTGAQAVILVGGRVAASTLPADTSAALGELGELTRRPRITTVGEGEQFVAAAPVEGGDGGQIGAVVLALDAGVVADVEGTFTRRLFLLAVGALVFTALLAGLAARRTVHPVRRLTRAAERLARGEADVRVGVDRDDEVGRLGAAFDRMAAALTERESELREAAEVEAELRSRLEIVTSSMDEALLASDEDGIVTTANPAAAELLGRPVDQLVGHPVRTVLTGWDELGDPLPAALAGDGGGPVVTRGAVSVDGDRVPVAASAASLAGGNAGPLGRVYVLRDITGEVEVERMKTEFLANVSHELRTPLTPIRGYAEVLRNRDVSREQTAEFATSIAESAGRLERVIGMLVDFAALEGGRMRVELEPTAVDEVVDVELERWRERVPDRRLTRYVRRGLPDVRVDPDLLERVLEELLDNAVKFSDGPVRVLADRPDADHVRVTVRDEGTGIPPEKVTAIEEDFQQADGSATRSVGGLGLGLSIVRRILERFDGDLAIESTPGRGTDVHVLLPVDRP